MGMGKGTKKCHYNDFGAQCGCCGILIAHHSAQPPATKRPYQPMQSLIRILFILIVFSVLLSLLLNIQTRREIHGWVRVIALGLVAASVMALWWYAL